MTSSSYDAQAALDHAVMLAAKGVISPDAVTKVAEEFLAFLNPPEVESDVPVYWDQDVTFPYYRWYRGSIGYLHAPSRGVSVDQDSYTLEELQGVDEGYVRVPAGHVLPNAVKEAIA